MPVVKCPCGQSLKVADTEHRFRCPVCRQVLILSATPRSSAESKSAAGAATVDLPSTSSPPAEVATLDAAPRNNGPLQQETLSLCPADPSPASTDTPAATLDYPAARAERTKEPPAQIGRFQIRQRLGEGAFGVVYQAYDPQLDREVAIKVAKASQLATPERVERFFREARSAAQLRHPHIVPLFETGQRGDSYYIASAFIHGQTLERTIAEQHPDWRSAAQLIRKLAEGVAYAHGEGIIHRDIKPANIMVDGKGEPLLMDFGLAARQGEGEERLTQDGSVMGTPLYMAPEQAEGKLDQIGPASDQYSLGCTLFELLTGQPPFQGPAQVVMMSHIKNEPPSPRKLRPKLPRDLETICLKCLQKEPKKRYLDCQALADDLRRWLDGEPVTARRASWGERTAKWVRRNPGVAALTLVLAIVLVGGLMASLIVAIQMRDLAEGETAARKDSQQAQEDLRRQLARQYVANGERALTAGDYSLAFLWFVKALEVDQGDPEREPIHRVRVAATWNRLPRPAGLIRHDSPIRYAELSPDGQLVVTGSYDGTARLWRVATGEPVGKVMRHGGYVYCARFSPDGKKVATASGDGTARLWDAATGEPASAPLEHGGAVNHLSFDAGGTRMVTACGSPNHLSSPPAGMHPDRDVAPREGKPQAAIWPLSDPSKPVVLKLSKDSRPYRAVFSRDGKRVATGDWSGQAAVWDAATGNLLLGGLKHKKQVTQIALSPEGTKLLTMEYGGQASLWDLTTNPPSAKLLNATFSSLQSRNQLEEAEFGADGTVTIGRLTFDSKSGAIRKERSKSAFATVHETGPGGKGYLLGSKDGLLQVWETRSGRAMTNRIRRDPANSDVALLTSDRRFVLASTVDGGGLRILDLAGEHGGTLALLSAGPVPRAEYSPDGERVAVSHPGLGCVQVYETKSGRPVSPSLQQCAPVREGEWGRMPLGYTSDGSKLITGSLTSVLQVWDTHSFRPIGPPMKASGGIKHLFLTPDDRRLLHTAVRGATSVYIEGWDLAEGKHLWPPIDNKWGAHLSLGPDGHRFATANASYEVRVWDVESGKQVLPTLWHTYFAGAPSFSPDGKRLASPGGDRLVRVWDLSDGQAAATLPLRAPARRTAFSPDGRLLAAAGASEVRVFDTSTWAVQSSLPNGVTSADALLFTPDSRLLVGGDDGVGQVWDARTGEAVTPPLISGPVGGERNGVIKLRGDGKQLVLSNTAPFALLIDLRPDERSVPELLRLAEMIASRRVSSAGEVEDLPAPELQEIWVRLKAESPTGVQCGPAELSAWRRRDIGWLIHPRIAGVDNLPLDEILPLLSQEVAEAPSDAYLRGLRAQLSNAKGNHAAVVQDLLEVLPTLQAVSLWWAYFEDSIARTKGWAAALETIKPRIEADPANPRLWRLRALLRGGLKDRDGALADYSEAIARGIDRDVYRQRTELLIEAGRWDEARADIRKALENSPSNSLLIRMVWVELARQDEPAAREALRVAVDSAGRTANPHVAEAVSYLTALLAHDPAQGVTLAEQAVAARPKDANVLTSLGGNQLRAGDAAKATATLRRAIEAEGKGGLCRTWLYLALTRARANDQEEAERWLGKARDWMRSRANLDWDDRLELQALLREAESTVRKK